MSAIVSRRAFLGVSALIVAASSAATIARCASMSAMGAMEMPGGWAMSMMWMRIPGQSWLGAAMEFMGMWVVMMVAMMLPSLIPTLLAYRESLGVVNSGRLTAIVGIGYFAVWAVLGVIVFALGSVLAETVMREPALARAAPIVVGAAVLIAGAVQQTRWKARQLAFCREAAGHGLTPMGGVGAAWRHGWCLGLHCIQACASLTAVMLALGVMDLRVMAIVGVTITIERLAPNGMRVAQVVGVAVVALGLVVIARAL